MAASDRPQPFQLWQQSAGDTERYMALLVEHGWIKRREQIDGLSDNERLIEATRHERAEAEARDLRRQFDSHALKVEDSRATCACGMWSMAFTGDGAEAEGHHAEHVKRMVAKVELSGGAGCQTMRSTTAGGEVITGIICGGRTGRKRCQVCKKYWSAAQCDYPTGGPCKKCQGKGSKGGVEGLRAYNCDTCAGTGRAMCNRHLCGSCTAKGPGQDEDYCPDHRVLAGLKMKREPCRWTKEAEQLTRRDCVHQGCTALVEFGVRCLYFPTRRRAMCSACGEAYMKASE
jgi:hypothetical protein